MGSDLVLGFFQARASRMRVWCLDWDEGFVKSLKS